MLILKVKFHQNMMSIKSAKFRFMNIILLNSNLETKYQIWPHTFFLPLCLSITKKKNTFFHYYLVI